VGFSNSLRERRLGSQMTPPLAPPKGMLTTAHLAGGWVPEASFAAGPGRTLERSEPIWLDLKRVLGVGCGCAALFPDAVTVSQLAGQARKYPWPILQNLTSTTVGRRSGRQHERLAVQTRTESRAEWTTPVRPNKPGV